MGSMGRGVGRILAIVAVFQLVLAAAFWFVLGNVPYAGEGLRLTAVILGVVGFGLLVVAFLLMRGAAARDRISAQGQPGTAEIVGLAQTGTFINNNPQVAIDLQVNVLGRSPYRVTVKEVVPLVMLNRLQGTVPVRVDPADPERVVIQWGLAGSQPGGQPAAGSRSDESLDAVARAMATSGAGEAAPVYSEPGQESISIEQLRAYVRANGISGTARIDRLEDSGQTVGDERLFTMTTTVTIPGRPTFTSGPSAAMVPLEKVGRIAVGVVLPIKVAPDNEHLQMFEWDRI